MTKEEFISGYKALQEQKKEIDAKLAALKEEYIKSLPFKVNDCVKISNDRRTIEKAWIVEIEIFLWNPVIVTLTINKPRKDGTRSSHNEYKYCVNISDVELLTDEPC